MNDAGVGPDAQMTTVEMEVGETAHRLPAWVEAVREADQIWGAYNSYLRGQRVTDIAAHFGVSVNTVYKWINKARDELPYHVVGKVAEMVNIRMEWINRAWRIAEQVEASQLRTDRKADMISKLMNASNAWLTAVEELTGARRGTGSRININTTEGGQAAVVFDMDKLLEMQRPRVPE